jgi:hypothetical protein
MTAAGAAFFIASFVGLYFFWRPARLLFCVFIIFGITMPLAPFGPNIVTGWMAFGDTCSDILLGVILCRIFTSPIRDQFARKHATAPEPTPPSS